MALNIKASDKQLLPDEAVLQRIVTLVLAGFDFKAIKSQLGIPEDRLNKLLKSDAYKAMIDDAMGIELKAAKNQAVITMSRLVLKAVKRIEDALDSGDHQDALAAAKMTLKAVGLEELKEQSESNLTIILPNMTTAPKENIIEVKGVKGDDSAGF